MKALISALILSLLATLFAQPSISFAESGKPNEVVAAVLRDWPPYYITNPETGEITGFAIDVINKVAEMSGIKLRYAVFSDWPDLNEALKNKQADLIPNMGITAQRQELYDFTVPYETFRISAFIRRSTTTLNKISRLTKMKVGVVETNQGHVIMKNRGVSDLQIYKSPEELFMGLLSGTVDAAVYPEQVFQKIALRSGLEDRIHSLGPPLQEIKRGIAVRKGEPELFKKIDNAVQQLIQLPEYAHIYEKWYGKPQPFWSVNRIFGLMGVLLGIVVAVMLIWRHISLLKLNKLLSETVEKLQQSESQHRAVIETSADGFWILNLNGHILEVNDAYVNRSGYSRRELLEMNITNLEALENPEETDAHIRNVRREGNDRFETMHRAKNGTLWPAEITSSYWPLENGRIFAFIRDITDRKQAEEDRIRYEKDLSESQRIAHLGSWRLDVETNEVFWTEELYKMYGFDPTLPPPPYTEHMKLFTPESWELLSTSLAKTRDTGVPYELELEMVKEDKSKGWIWVRGEAVFDQNGKTIGLWGAAQDITDRKQAENQLIESEKRYRALFENMNSGFVLYEVVQDEKGDPIDLVIVAANEGFDATTGLNTRQVTGKRLTRVLPGIENDAADWIGTFGKVALTGEPLQFEQGSDLLGYYYSINAYKAGPGQCAVTFLDITDRKRAEEDKENLQTQLIQAQKMEAIGTLTSGISHDFNNLLQAVNGYTQLLLMEKSKRDPDYPSLMAIQDAGFRASQLVRQLLLFSRKADSTKKPIEVQHAVEQAKKILERTIPKMVEIQVITGNRLWPINADPVQIEQLLLNLGTNAADAMPDGGQLLFEIENVTLDAEYASRHLGAQPGSYVHLSVSDTGHGMDQETRDKIFEPFFTTKEFGKGTGLGLASVYGIVQSHGGYIACYSEIGQGTMFKIYFPAMERPEVDEKMEVEPKPIPRGTETVLLVDDEEAIRGFAQQALMKFGYKVMTASTGEEALELYSSRSNEIDLVVMDLGMPGIGGHKCLQGLLELNPRAKVVIASGYSVTGQVKQSMEAGALGYIGKPYQLNELLNKVRAVLDGENPV